MKRISAIILAAVLVLTMLAGCSQNTSVSDNAAATQAMIQNYGDQLPSYLGRQYYFDGKPISIQESNFYYVNAFMDLSTYASMGYFPSTILGYIDLSASYPGEEYGTYGEYFVKYAENSIESTFILCSRAEAEGVTVSDDAMEYLESVIENIRTGSAVPAGQTLDEYLMSYYGPGMDEANFRKALERYYLADAYSKVYCDNYQFSDDEKYVPYVRYALFYAPDTADQASKDQALAAANAMKDACTTIDDLTGLAENALAAGTVRDQGDIAVPRGQMVPKFEEWSYGEGRTEGELDVIYAPEYGYFVVGYLGSQEQDSATLEQTALQQLSQSILDEIDEGKHDFHSKDAPLSTLQTTDVLIIVFFTLAGVAIVAVIVILIASSMKNKNGSSSPKSSSGKNGSKGDNRPASSGKSKKVKKEAVKDKGSSDEE